jgi:hypothetical protein
MTKRNFKTIHYFIGMIVALLLFYSPTIYSQTNWFAAGSDPGKYKMGNDSIIQHNGENVMTIKSIDQEIKGFGSFMQNSKPGEYIGKRIKMTGYMKSKNVAEWAGFWLRVDQEGSEQSLSFDNMHVGKENRSVKGTTDWKKYEIVLNVPKNASNIAFGALLVGSGQIWFDSINFEVVDKSVQTTGIHMMEDSEFEVVNAQSCAIESTLKSLNSDTSTILRIKNSTSGKLTLYWINYSGQRDTSANQIYPIPPGTYFDRYTYVTHPFIVIGSNGKCYGIYQATAKPSIGIVKD